MSTKRTGAPNHIVPRWEWRTFGSRFVEVEAGFQEQLLAAPVRSSEETYIIGPALDANVKIRGGLLDVKVLRSVSVRGLELWEPWLKSPFPLDAAVVQSVLRLYHLPPPRSTGSIETGDAFIQDVVGAYPPLAAVDVTKQRRGLALDGCSLEVANLTVAGSAICTVAVEGESPSRIWQVVESLGLSDRENVNYVKALHECLSLTDPLNAAVPAPGRARL